MNYCPNCGATLQPGQDVCVNCGKIVNPNTQSQQPQQQPIVDQKSKLVAGLLGIFLGALGVHNFYLGYTGKGIAQVLLSTIGACIIVGPAISGIWGFVEGILILTGSIDKDVNGIPLKD